MVWLLGLGIFAPAAGAESQAGAGGFESLLEVLERRGAISSEERRQIREAAAPPTPAPPTPVPPTPVPPPTAAPTPAARSTPAWYERLSVRGYVQTRYHAILSSEGAALDVPADKSVSRTDSFLIRRGRLILSGDVGDHLFLYLQPDMMASPTSGDFALQLRDLYADIALDRNKEFRLRIGQSKVPFGWVNLQSSQNRLAMERPDALNSAVEGERDIGAFLYWAPQHIRARFRHLVASGLRGSGDYGVVGLGAYSGQGLNRRDRNGEPHGVARVTWPFQLASGQFVELGAQGTIGRFVVNTEKIDRDGVSTTPTQPGDGALDERLGATFVWYPQPFGLEAEWNFGRGPALSRDFSRIEARDLHGGYVLASWRVTGLQAGTVRLGEATPFVRWQYFDGGRKFGRNAAPERIHEVDFGVEWLPIPAVELLLSYTPTFVRTNTSSFPFRNTTSAQRLGVQLQFNY